MRPKMPGKGCLGEAGRVSALLGPGERKQSLSLSSMCAWLDLSRKLRSEKDVLLHAVCTICTLLCVFVYVIFLVMH